MQAALQLSRAPFVAPRANVNRSDRHQRLQVRAYGATTQLSPEQQAFLERKRQGSNSPAPAAPARGRSTAAPAGGLSSEQQAFLERKRRESSVSAAPAPTRGRSAPRAPPARRPTSAAPAPRPASNSAPASYSAPAPPGGLSAEQRDFLERKARETSRSPTPAPTRGRSAPRAPPARRPTSAAPAARPASNSAPASYSAPAPSGGLSAEQRDFLERKARETSRSPAPAPTRGRSAVSARPARPSARPVSNSAGASALNSSFSSPAPAGGLSAEQRAFLERKASESRSPAPAAARGRSAAPSSNGAAAGLSAEQRAFLERKRQGQR